MFCEGSVISWWHPAIEWMSMFTVGSRHTSEGGRSPSGWQSINLHQQFWQHRHKDKLHQVFIKLIRFVYMTCCFWHFCPCVHKLVIWSFSVYLLVEERLLQNVEQEPDAFKFCLFADALYHKVWNEKHTHYIFWTFTTFNNYHLSGVTCLKSWQSMFLFGCTVITFLTIIIMIMNNHNSCVFGQTMTA